MSKSMPPLDLSKSLSMSSKQKTPPNELEKIPLIKTKPTLPTSISTRTPPGNNSSKETLASYRHTVSGGNKEVPVVKSAAPVPSKVSPVVTSPAPLTTTKNSPTIAQKTEKDRLSGEFQEAIPHKQYSDLLERMQKLEALVEKQNQAIDELRSKLQVETDMRMLLQEKVMQDVQV